MPSPDPSWTLVNVRWSGVALDGGALVGTIEALPSIGRMKVNGKIVIVNRPFTATIVNNAATLALPASNDPDVTPLGWTWTITEKIVGRSDVSYVIEVPISLVGPGIDLSEVSPTTESSGVPVSVITRAEINALKALILASLTPSDVAAIATSGSASDLTTGTVPRPRLALANVAFSGSASDITTGVLPSSVIPSIATISSTSLVHSQAAMLALTGVSVGHIAIRDDPGDAAYTPAKEFYLTATPASTLSNWSLVNLSGINTVNGHAGSSVVLDKSDLGLSNVDNTADADKPISTAAQAVLDTKAPLTDPSFLGTVSGVTQSMVGLDAVDNTADEDKPVSIATQEALDTQELKLCQMLGRPTHPGNLDVSARTSTSVTLIWDASIAPTGGSTTNYRVYKDGTQIATSITATTRTVTGLVSNTSYSFKVVPYNTTGDGPESDAVTAITLDASVVAPSVPDGVQITAFTDTSVSLSWNASTSVYAPLTNYTIYRDNVSIGTSTSPSYTNTSLTASTTYVYKIVASNSLGDSAASDIVTVRTAATPTAPGVRGTFSFIPNSGTTSPYSVTLSSGVQNGDVGYAVVVITDGANAPASMSSPSGSWSLVDGPRANGTTQRAWLWRKDSMTTADAGATLSVTASPAAGSRPGVVGVVLSGAQAAWDAEVQWLKNPATTSLTINAITPTVKNTRLLYLSMGRFMQTTGNQYNLPSGWTTHANLRSTQSTSPQIGACVGSKVLSTAGVTNGPESGSFNDTASEFSWAITVAPGSPLPSAPQNLHYTTKTANSITWAWSAPSFVPSSDPVTNYKVYSAAGVLLATLSSTTLTYTRSSLTANTPYGLWVTAVNGAGEGAATPVVTVTTGAATARFAGDPGAGKILIGATHNAKTNDEFDKRIFPGATSTSPPTKRFKLDRIYNTSDKFLIDTGMRSKLQSNAAAGRISVFSWKGISDGGSTTSPYTLQQIVNGDADGDIDANATFMANLGGTVWWAFHHEPENLNITGGPYPARMDLYRQAYRRQITRIRAIANNVAFCSPFFTNFDWSDNNWKTVHDMRWFHPNYTGDPRTQGTTGGGHWLSDGPFGGSWVNMDGIDYYNPDLGNKLVSTSRNQTFMNQFQKYLDRRSTDGFYNLPTVIGEGGFYNTLATLDDNGVTNQSQFNDMVTSGVSGGLVGCVFWNAKEALFDDTKDLYPTVGAKSAALATTVNNNSTVVVMG